MWQWFQGKRRVSWDAGRFPHWSRGLPQVRTESWGEVEDNKLEVDVCKKILITREPLSVVVIAGVCVWTADSSWQELE